MRALLDSHTALWWLSDSSELGQQARHAIEQAEIVYFSAVSIWELGIKQARGKLTMPQGLAAALRSSGIEPLPISIEHAEFAPSLPPHHRDPFDRMLIAQAHLKSLTLITADRALAPYDVVVLDART